MIKDELQHFINLAEIRDEEINSNQPVKADLLDLSQFKVTVEYENRDLHSREKTRVREGPRDIRPVESNMTTIGCVEDEKKHNFVYQNMTGTQQVQQPSDHGIESIRSSRDVNVSSLKSSVGIALKHFRGSQEL